MDISTKFWVVTIPTKQSELGDICFQADVWSFAMNVMGGLKRHEIVLVTDSSGTAEAKARELLKKAGKQFSDSATIHSLANKEIGFVDSDDNEGNPFKVGDVVKFKHVVEPGDEKERMRVVELRGPRVWTESLVLLKGTGSLLSKARSTYNASDLVKA